MDTGTQAKERNVKNKQTMYRLKWQDYDTENNKNVKILTSTKF